VAVLDGEACGVGSRRLILAFWRYAAAMPEDSREAVIHPYYPASQEAWRAAEDCCRAFREAGISLRRDGETKLKRILNRLPFLSLGRNTLSYLAEEGCRFHVEAFGSEEPFPITDQLEETAHGFHCGSCRRCLEACPSGAITGNGFEKEKCLRWWMLNGRFPPKEIRRKMGNRLLGCDECEACCPHNPPPGGRQMTVPLREMITGEGIPALIPLIGKNYAIPNRVRTQACVLAESMGRTDLRAEIRHLAESARSEAVRLAAESALRHLAEEAEREEELGSMQTDVSGEAGAAVRRDGSHLPGTVL
jgi:ferredoxin